MNHQEDHSNDPLHAKKKAWSGRFSEPVDAFVLRYTASVDFDKRMALADAERVSKTVAGPLMVFQKVAHGALGH